MKLYPLKFRPLLKESIWGGEIIKKFKHIDSDLTDIGESWEISSVKGSESVIANGFLEGETINEAIGRYKGRLVGNKAYEKYGEVFPLLVKYIDAHQDLSMQVHPDDELAARRHAGLGKSEMWYVLDTAPDAKIRCGLSREFSPEEFKEIAGTDKINEVVKVYDSAPGDVYYLPAGRLHAIGAGNFLIEIQETSDVTYRVYDYGRLGKDGNPRELHTDLALEAIDYKYYPGCRAARVKDVKGDVELVKCKYFEVNRLSIEGKREMTAAADSFTVIMAIEGEGTLVTEGAGPMRLVAGETVLIPAETEKYALEGELTVLHVV